MPKTVKEIFKGTKLPDLITTAERIAKIGALPAADETIKSLQIEVVGMAKTINAFVEELAKARDGQ